MALALTYIDGWDSQASNREKRNGIDASSIQSLVFDRARLSRENDFLAGAIDAELCKRGFPWLVPGNDPIVHP